MSLDHNDSLRLWARRYVRIMLERSRGNKRATARVLGISYHTLQAYLRAPIAPDDAGPAQPNEKTKEWSTAKTEESEKKTEGTEAKTDETGKGSTQRERAGAPGAA